MEVKEGDGTPAFIHAVSVLSVRQITSISVYIIVNEPRNDCNLLHIYKG